MTSLTAALQSLSRKERELLAVDLERRKAIDHDHEHDLAAWIEDVVYPYHPGNKKAGGTWRLGRHHRDEWLPLMERSRALILGPRDHGKSTCAEGKVLHRSIFDAPLETRIVSETDPQAHERLDHIKNYILHSPPLRWLAGKGAELWNKGEIKLANGSIIKAHGFWSGVRGGKCDLLVIDDPISYKVMYSDLLNKRSRERFKSEILNLAKADSQIIILGTLQREDDLYSSVPDAIYDPHVYDAIVNEETHEVLWPEVWSWEKLMQRKAELDEDMGKGFFGKEFRNQPVSFEGALVEADKLVFLKTMPEGIDERYTGWDQGTKDDPKTDYTAKVTIAAHDGVLIIENAWRKRLGFSDRLAAVREHAGVDGPLAIGIEDNAFQSDAVQELIRTTRLPVKGVRAEKSKRARFAPVATMMETGKIQFGPNLPTEYLMEILKFTGEEGCRDDWVDATVIAVQMARRFRKGSIGGGVVRS